MSGNLFELRKDWLIPPTITPSKPPIKIEPQIQEQAAPSATAVPKTEKCRWGLNCPICKNMQEWNSEHQKEHLQNVSKHTATATLDARSSMSPDPELSEAPKLPALPVADI